MMAKSPLPGIREMRCPHTGIEVVRIHYSADPDKNEAWMKAKKIGMTSAAWSQEMEIDAYAKSGALLYPEFNPELTIREPFPIPHEWPRTMAIDPHPRVPHAFLWMAVSPWDEHVYYREYWPSRAYGLRGDVPEDDEVYHIDDYAETIRKLESSEVSCFGPNGLADNGGKNEYISRRIMDTAGKAWETTRQMGKPSVETFYDTYAEYGISCENAKKDFQAGRDKVGKKLRSRRISDGTQEIDQSQIIIFDTLHELILELRTARYPMLTPTQAEKKDPEAVPLKKRGHMTDCLRYIEMSDPTYFERDTRPTRPRYNYKGIPY